MFCHLLSVAANSSYRAWAKTFTTNEWDDLRSQWNFFFAWQQKQSSLHIFPFLRSAMMITVAFKHSSNAICSKTDLCIWGALLSTNLILFLRIKLLYWHLWFHEESMKPQMHKRFFYSVKIFLRLLKNKLFTERFFSGTKMVLLWHSSKMPFCKCIFVPNQISIYVYINHKYWVK